MSSSDSEQRPDWPRKNTEELRLKHGTLTDAIIGVFFEVYRTLGFGFLESVYEGAMEIALSEAGLTVVRQAPVPVRFRGRLVGDFRADLIVNDLVLLEFKAARAIDPSFEAQTLNYLRATPIEVGLLLNFGPKPEFKRYLFDNNRKQSS
jgi:GxxExxY protein